MIAKQASDRREAVVLAGDGALVTIGACAIGMGSAMALHAWGLAPLGEPDPTSGQFFLGLISWLLQVGGVVVGPVLVWRLHRRRITGAAIVGALVGVPVTVATVMAAAALAELFNWVASPFTDSEYAGPIALAALVVGALLVLSSWVLADAVRDLTGGEGSRQHVALDIVRVVAAVALIGAGALGWSIVAGGGDLEGFDILMAMGVLGSIVVTTAHLADRWQGAQRRSESRPAHTA